MLQCEGLFIATDFTQINMAMIRKKYNWLSWDTVPNPSAAFSNPPQQNLNHEDSVFCYLSDTPWLPSIQW